MTNVFDEYFKILIKKVSYLIIIFKYTKYLFYLYFKILIDISKSIGNICLYKKLSKFINGLKMATNSNKFKSLKL